MGISQWWNLITITIWLFNIAMENPSQMEVYSWENHLFLWAIYTMAMLNNQRVQQCSPLAILETLVCWWIPSYRASGS